MPSCCSCFPLKKCTHSRPPSPRPISSPQTELTDDAHPRSPSPRSISSPLTELTDDDEFHSSPSFTEEATDNTFDSLSSSEKGTTSYDVFISCIDG
ncbi:hypothetical protein L6164_002958 [Bauhinia variegata]|uniref:Uncharacterized protein n=1 Tax=Bauhinia variegata TaxID=167791 RepID=A0ACB9PZW6_BAUVA|nr:hypothetical protein L6164_002958 [Bauhinia variegata]